MIRQQVKEKADAWSANAHVAFGAPATSFAVCDTHGNAWCAAHGMADLELDTPASPHHLFRIGSVSKVLTTTAAARLVSRGLLELDTPIFYYLPELPAPHRGTTLRHLFTHRGGIRHYLPKDLVPDQMGGPIFTRRGWDRAAILAAFINDDLVAPVGERVSYSSWGYSLASLVMEAAAGQPFLDLIEAEIARHFGLTSLAPDRMDRVVAGRARGYVGARERAMMQAQFPDAGFDSSDGEWTNAPPNNPAYCWAGAGYLSDMPDLARFGAALIEGPGSRITPQESALLFTPLTARSEASPPLGLGWRVDEDAAGRPRWHHAGATPGGRAVLVVYPAQGLAVAMASNCMTLPGDVLGPASELADIFAA